MQQASLSFTVSVPVFPYIRKYALGLSGGVEPLVLSRDTFPGSLVLALMDKHFNNDGYELKKATAELQFSLHIELAKYHGAFLLPNEVAIINNVLDGLFRQELMARYEGIAVGQGKTLGAIKKAVDLTRQKYGIEEDDFSYENFRKTIYRERKGKSQNTLRKMFAEFVP